MLIYFYQVPGFAEEQYAIKIEQSENMQGIIAAAGITANKYPCQKREHLQIHFEDGKIIWLMLLQVAM